MYDSIDSIVEPESEWLSRHGAVNHLVFKFELTWCGDCVCVWKNAKNKKVAIV